MRWNWQNLETESFRDDQGRYRERATVRGIRHGRGWLRWGGDDDRRSSVVGIEWKLGKPVYLISVSAGVEHDEDHLKASVNTPLASLYVSAESGLTRCIARRLVPQWGESREVSLRLSRDDLTLYWTLWSDPMRGTSRQGSFSLVRSLLGGWRQVEWDHITTRAVLIPMPERSYEATVELRDHVSWWPRLPFLKRRLRCANVDIPGGIAFPGKGENAWDVGEDGIFGMSCPAASVEEAVAKVVQSVLETRMKRHGSHVYQSEGAA